jgi:hypothetical protein
LTSIVSIQRGVGAPSVRTILMLEPGHGRQVSRVGFTSCGRFGFFGILISID